MLISNGIKNAKLKNTLNWTLTTLIPHEISGLINI